MNVDGVFSGHCLVDGGRPFFLPPLVSQFCWGQAGESSLWRLLSPICQWIRGCLGCVGSPSGDVRLGGVDLLGSVSLHFSSNLEKLWPPRPHFSPHDRPACRDRVVGASSHSRRGAARGRSGAPFSVPPPGCLGVCHPPPCLSFTPSVFKTKENEKTPGVAFFISRSPVFFSYLPCFRSAHSIFPLASGTVAAVDGPLSVDSLSCVSPGSLLAAGFPSHFEESLPGFVSAW